MNDHGIMQTSALCKRPEELMIPCAFQILIFCLYLHFIINILCIENTYNLEKQNSLYYFM